ncbi:MAG: two component signal transduction system hybrid histidine kinase / response regulator with PAS senso, partial [Algoriphagus marincola HL-49]
SDAKKSQIPILALTATSLEEIKEELGKIGFDDYVPKPFTPDLLYEKISKFERKRKPASD